VTDRVAGKRNSEWLQEIYLINRVGYHINYEPRHQVIRVCEMGMHLRMAADAIL
jgi:hypothetical protein